MTYSRLLVSFHFELNFELQRYQLIRLSGTLFWRVVVIFAVCRDILVQGGLLLALKVSEREMCIAKVISHELLQLKQLSRNISCQQNSYDGINYKNWVNVNYSPLPQKKNNRCLRDGYAIMFH